MVLDAIREMARLNALGTQCGMPSYCTAHHYVIETILQHAATHDGCVLLEATCNQVNQDGGYTGLRPADFVVKARAAAARAGLPAHRLILGGDHLGPNPWRRLPALDAMRHATVLVRDYVRAGFEKIHLDASMALGSDGPRLDPELVAERAAELCSVAEATGGDLRPVYVIGTEVPVPGGETAGMSAITVTREEDLLSTIDSHRRAFAKRGLEDAFNRVVGIVAQPGVDFDQTSIMPLQPGAAEGLKAALSGYGGIVGEAHSTDFQPASALRELVTSHFAFLKVGPELTFAYREAILSLAAIEGELVSAEESSGIREVLLDRMRAEPGHWRDYYHGHGVALQLQLLFSYSDRIRYYWLDPAIAHSVGTLLRNLQHAHVPAPLWRQHVPIDELAPAGPADVIRNAITRVVRRYEAACTPQS